MSLEQKKWILGQIKIKRNEKNYSTIYKKLSSKRIKNYTQGRVSFLAKLIN